jgi:hypothetical protein
MVYSSISAGTRRAANIDNNGARPYQPRSKE